MNLKEIRSKISDEVEQAAAIADIMCVFSIVSGSKDSDLPLESIPKAPLRRELLKRYYLRGQTWERIAEEMHYSPTQIYNQRKRALDEIDLDFLPDMEQCVL